MLERRSGRNDGAFILGYVLVSERWKESLADGGRGGEVERGVVVAMAVRDAGRVGGRGWLCTATTAARPAGVVGRAAEGPAVGPTGSSPTGKRIGNAQVLEHVEEVVTNGADQRRVAVVGVDLDLVLAKGAHKLRLADAHELGRRGHNLRRVAVVIVLV